MTLLHNVHQHNI